MFASFSGISISFFLLAIATPVVAMPEYGEVIAQIFVLTRFITFMAITFGASALRVKNIWIDSSVPEQDAKKAEPSSAQNVLQQLGLPYPINEKCTIRWGMNTFQAPVWPFMLASRADLSKLVPIDIISNPRNIILNFASCCVQVSALLFLSLSLVAVLTCCKIQLFTHTLPQIYTLDDWYNVICLVPKQVSVSIYIYILWWDDVSH